MKLLVVGSGGREHALCWSLAASPMVDSLICAPGSDAIAGLAARAAVAADDLEGLVRLARHEAVDLVVIGPEKPLVMGLVDRLEETGIKAFGPAEAAARLEGSKAFMKAFCSRHRIPTATHRVFSRSQKDKALAYLKGQRLPLVIKADGLAAGKGVTIARSLEQAQEAIEASFAGRFGAAGSRLVIEEFLEGEELSLFALCDGETALPFGTARDYKPLLDGDEGPNTGGMGAISPPEGIDKGLVAEIMERIVQPTLAGMKAEGTPFKGVLYAGLMLTGDGPRLLEYNVRFGDPECQVLLPLLMSDLASLLEGACGGMLRHMGVRWFDRTAVSVVMASPGYPENPTTGERIDGLEPLEDEDDVIVFHAATRRDGEVWRTNGGRVLNVTALGRSLEDARAKAYAAVAAIDWPGARYRRDIGAARSTVLNASGSGMSITGDQG